MYVLVGSERTQQCRDIVGPKPKQIMRGVLDRVVEAHQSIGLKSILSPECNGKLVAE